MKPEWFVARYGFEFREQMRWASAIRLSPSAYEDEGDFVAETVAGQPLRPGIVHRLAVHVKLIKLGTGTERNGQLPRTVVMTSHWMGLCIPAIEVANQRH